MPPKKTQPPIQQTAIGNDNIQVVGSNNVITRITNFFAGDTEQQRAMRNRRAMLELVRNTWVKGVLEKSLYNEVLIDLGKEERPGAIDHPWDMQVQLSDKENHTLPQGTSMVEVFDEMNGAMLILGEPGSGKTTMLLELARGCIARAQQDDSQPIPVVFNLSSWDGKQTVDDWLISELNIKYNVARKIAQYWVENDDLQLMLDGLDEVKLENRETCVKAINDFRQMHGLTTLIAVCSRIADYEVLKIKLHLSGAIFLNPLTPRQIEAYFEQAGSVLEGIHQTLKNDETLQEMAKQPLILSIIALAYQGKPVETFARENLDAVEIRRGYLFDVYIQQMFTRIARTKNEIYAPEQTRHRLAWLAQKMMAHSAVPYVYENMQPGWLNQRQQNFYRLSVGMLWGLLGALISGLLFGWWRGLPTGLSLGLIIGLVVGLSAGQKGYDRIDMIDTLAWDWRKARIGFVIALLVELLFILSMYVLINRLSSGLSDMMWLAMILIGVLFAFFIGMYWGLTTKSISQSIFPGQRITLSLRNLLFGFGLMGLSLALMGMFMGVLIGELPKQFFVILFIVLIGSAERFGGVALAKHYILRLIISRNNHLPWHLFSFLDYCVDRVFLRRVGGGYIFVHRLLMEHFADMYTADEK